MATITFDTPDTVTINRARLESIYFMRVGDDKIFIEGTVVVGFWDANGFHPKEHKSFSECVPLAEAVTFFGTTPDPILDAMERKVLEWMQLRGALPSGTVS